MSKLHNNVKAYAYKAGRATLAILLLTLAAVPFTPAQAAVNCSTGSMLNIVAHEDDDLLYLNPDIQTDIVSGRCVRTVFVTAGDVGGAPSYWQGRESGIKAAYAKMAGVTNTWTASDAGIAGHPISVSTLKNKPKVSVAFMRLPDGGLDGNGFSDDGNGQSLEKLWKGTLANMYPVDGTAGYTKQGLIDALKGLMQAQTATTIRTQDYVGSFGGGDHSDHYGAAYFARAAHNAYTSPHVFKGYQGYGSQFQPQNVTGAKLTLKSNYYYTYAAFDSDVCNNATTCKGTEFAAWLKRQYVVGTENGGGVTPTPSPTPVPTVTPTPTPTITPTPTPSPGVVNIAGQASVTASSEDASTSQLAIRAIDGLITGYPADYTKEWATVGGGAGSWIKLTWSTPRSISKVVLYDRPNVNDQITGGTITFSDGSSISTGTLVNEGTATTLNFAGKTVVSLQLTISAVSYSTENVGLSEIQVY